MEDFLAIVVATAIHNIFVIELVLLVSSCFVLTSYILLSFYLFITLLFAICHLIFAIAFTFSP